MLPDDLNDIGGVLHLSDGILVNHCANTLSLGCKLPTKAAMAVSWGSEGLWKSDKGDFRAHKATVSAIQNLISIPHRRDVIKKNCAAKQ